MIYLIIIIGIILGITYYGQQKYGKDGWKKRVDHAFGSVENVLRAGRKLSLICLVIGLAIFLFLFLLMLL